jgi:Mrp family chromosome partitioning ATPase/capsular polysaccharide biosynthesis protein
MNKLSRVAAGFGASGRRVWIVCICALVAAAIGAGVAAAGSAHYQARSQVGFSKLSVPTQATLAATPQIAARALAMSGVKGMTASDLLAHTRVTVPTDSDLVVIQVTQPSSARARVLADAFAQAFVIARRAQIEGSGAPLRQQLQAELASLRQAVNISAPTPARFVARAQYQTVLRQLTALRTSADQAARSVYVVSTAGSGTQVTAPVARYMGVGLIIGLIVGILAAMFVRTRREVTEVLGAPVLGRVPGSIVLADDPRRQLRSQPVGDAIREVRSRLLLARLPGSSTIAIAGAQDSVHTAPTTLGLAFALAEMGRRVSVVDLANADPSMDWWMGAAGSPGVAEVASGHVRLDDVLISYDRGGHQIDSLDGAASGVRLLPAGRMNGNPWDVVSSPAVEDIMRRLRRDSDIVLAACPRLMGGGSAAAVIGMADALVAVVDMSTLNEETADDLREYLEGLPGGAVGAVLVEPLARGRRPLGQLRPVPAT